MDTRDEILAGHFDNRRQLQEKLRRAEDIRNKKAEQTRESSREYHQSLAEQRIARVETALSALEIRINTAQRELDEKMSRKGSRIVRVYYTSGGYYRYETRGRSISLSPDASQIEKLRQERDQLRARINSMKRQQANNP